MYTKSLLSFFWYHIKPYKWLYMVMLLAPITTSFSPFCFHYSLKWSLDILNNPNGCTYQNLMAPAILFLGTELMLNVVWRISDLAEWKAEPLVRRSIILNSYNEVQHHSYPFFQHNLTGTINSKLKTLLEGYDRFWDEMHHGLLLRLLKIIVNIVALCMIHITIGGFIVVWGIVYIPILYLVSIKLNKLAVQEAESRHYLLGLVADRISNLFSILSFAARKHEYKGLKKEINDDFIPRQVRLYRYNFFIQIIGWVFYLMMFGVVLFLILDLKMRGLISIGDFAFVFGLTTMIAEDIWHTTVSLQDIARVIGNLRSSLTVLEDPKGAQEAEGKVDLIIKEPKIAFKNVCFSYDSKNKVFDHLNLTIQAGEKIGLVGHSGAGKSSLVNLLLGYFKNIKGHILVDGTNTQTVKEDSLRSQIGLIPQDTSLFNRTLLENIRYGRAGATDEEVIKASKKAYIHDYIQTLPQGYQTYVGEKGAKLSGGQRQRIAIARVILKDAPILILDEATSALDSETEKYIQESLDTLMQDKKKTVIAIAHRLSTLQHMDRLIVLEKGRVVEQGRHAELIKNEKSIYKKLWELQTVSSYL